MLTVGIVQALAVGFALLVSAMVTTQLARRQAESERGVSKRPQGAW